MKKIFASLLLIASVFAFASCNDDGPRVPTYIGIGTLDKPVDQYTLALDGASTCIIPDSSLLVYNRVNQPGKRVIAIFNFLSSRGDEKTISLQDVKGVLTKPLAAKPVTPEDEQNLGNDILRVDKAWIGGGFLNVKYFYLTDGIVERPHYINAYDTGEVDKNGNHIIEMRHNSNGHQPLYFSYFNYVSFAMPEVEEGSTYILRYRYDLNENVYESIGQ